MKSTANAKLTDDEERAKDAPLGTSGCPRSSSFGPASGSAFRMRVCAVRRDAAGQVADAPARCKDAPEGYR